MLGVDLLSLASRIPKPRRPQHLLMATPGSHMQCCDARLGRLHHIRAAIQQQPRHIHVTSTVGPPATHRPPRSAAKSSGEPKARCS